jgi:DNA-binding response OmpR family regulator
MAIILIVEDEPELVKVLRSYLEQAGFSVLAAGRGDTGLSAWEHKHPDLVILDLSLPGMDGLDVAREIRRKGDTPIIMLTARVEEADRLIGLELGADDYVLKPFPLAKSSLGYAPCYAGPALPQRLQQCSRSPTWRSTWRATWSQLLNKRLT